MNFYKHYLGDFQRDTGHLSLMERGAYLALLHHAYATEKPLPDNIEALCRVARAQSKQERDAVRAVLSFFDKTPDGLTQKRVLRELEKASHLRENSRRSGGKGGRPKKPSGFQNENPVGFENKSPPDTRHQINPLPPPSGAPPCCESLRAPRSAVTREGCRLPDGWKPDEVGWAFACSSLGEPAALRTLDSFRDYWTAKPGKDGRKSDWTATWRNWVRREADNAETRKHRGTGRRLSAVERVNPNAGDWWAEQCRAQGLEGLLGPDDRGLRPQVDEQLRPDADDILVTDHRVVG